MGPPISAKHAPEIFTIQISTSIWRFQTPTLIKQPAVFDAFQQKLESFVGLGLFTYAHQNVEEYFWRVYNRMEQVALAEGVFDSDSKICS